jgi:transposase-like protein
MLNIEDLFKGRHFDREIIILCVRWYLRFKLSFRDLVEMMVERGISLAHTTIMRWIQRYVPDFERRWNRFACRAGASWRVDETYVKIKGRCAKADCRIRSRSMATRHHIGRPKRFSANIPDANKARSGLRNT